MESVTKKGKVILVGAGPGNPGLLTLKGMKCIKKADVIIYDYLVSNDILDYASSNAKLIYVGKKSGYHSFSQKEINEILISKVNKYKKVVRLKGGDPFVFGRGGEEIEFLTKFNIDFEIVPGITSAIAASTYSGIPLTHRDYASDLTFITGHENPYKKKSNINWEAISQLNGTLVFFMGIKNIREIVEKLVLNGKEKTTPVAIVRWGSLAKQTTVVGTLKNIAKKATSKKMKPPAIIIIGEVVSLRKNMRWFDKSSLIGKSIVITRARSQASTLNKCLSNLGANCIEFPVIKIVPKKNLDILTKSVKNIMEYDWIIFTSVNSVKIFFKHIFELKKDSRVLHNVKVAAIGSSTNNELFKFGILTDLLPENYCAESIIESFRKFKLTGKKICLPRAQEARKLLPNELEKMGANVDIIPIYKTIDTNTNVKNIVKKFKKKEIDMITFTSSSTVKNFKNLFLNSDLDILLKNVSIAAIGPITADTADKLGFNVDVVASNYTIKGLCNSIIKYYS